MKNFCSREGNYIYFGSYPQTKVSDSKLTTLLNSLAGRVPTSSNSQKWTSYDYYINGKIIDFMWYIDIEYNETKYRGVYFTSYRPDYCSSMSLPSDSNQKNNGYNTSTVYWFEYEPIKWRILEESNGCYTILAAFAIDSQQYFHNSFLIRTRNDYADMFSVLGIDIDSRRYDYNVYVNNYGESEIRSWLNNAFYNTAFNDLQKSLIQTITVCNKASSTGDEINPYACDDTTDKVWLLSYRETVRDFCKCLSSESERVKEGTDYAKSQGLKVNESNCCWWLRSPNCYSSDGMLSVDDSGDFLTYTCVQCTSCGVIPALKIKLL